MRARPGRFELAKEGTLFLDEIGDMPMPMQAKILRVLQEREFERVGGTRTIAADVRVIAATHRDLEALVAQGTFRQDLFYRLQGVGMHLPALRERLGTVLTAGSGPEALEILKRQQIDLLITDQRMPDMSGTELLIEARKLFPDAKRVLLTAYADSEAAIAATSGHQGMPPPEFIFGRKRFQGVHF